jgi:LEA14-like dessication related protein
MQYKSMKMRNIKLYIVIASLLALGSCKALMQYTNILKCDFRMESLKNPTVAGIDVNSVKNFSDLSFLQAGKITTAYLGGNVPLVFTLNMEAKNPNTTEARLAQFDWIVKIDDVQIASGTNQSEYVIPANDGRKIIPLRISVNLLDVINKESKDTLINFGLNLADASDKPTRVSLQIRPTVNVGNVPITYPGYLSLGTEF